MPGFLLHAGAVVQCVHGGMAQPTVVNPRVRVSGQPVVMQAAPHTIAGCTFPPPPAANGPCLTAQWVMGAVERRTDKYERATAIEDSCMGLIHFGPSLQFFIQSDLWDRNSDAGKFLLRGTEGMLHVTETKLRLFNASTAGWSDVGSEPVKLQRKILGTMAQAFKVLGTAIKEAPEFSAKIR